jgi:hypothetical protein
MPVCSIGPASPAPIMMRKAGASETATSVMVPMMAWWKVPSSRIEADCSKKRNMARCIVSMILGA